MTRSGVGAALGPSFNVCVFSPTPVFMEGCVRVLLD